MFAKIDVHIFCRILGPRHDAHCTAGFIGNFGNDVDDPAHGIRPVKRARRTADDFDAVDIAEVQPL